MKAYEAKPEQTKANNTVQRQQSKPAVEGKGYAGRTTYPTSPVQRQKNNTGLPDDLKTSVENLSGISMDDVTVHYNAAEPAGVNALAYTQGTEIYVGPGQEKHLPHEAWHVVQQKQGRVATTRQVKGKVAINDDPALEQEADQMGKKAMAPQADASGPVQAKTAGGDVIQRAVGFEFETGYKIEKKEGDNWTNLKKMDVVKEYPNNIKLTADENSGGFSAIELVLDPPVQETDPEKFTKALATFLKISTAFDAMKPGKGPTPTPERFDRISGVSGSSKYLVTPTWSGFLGNPQLTGGIAFEKLYTFLDEATKKQPATSTVDKHVKAKDGLTQYTERTDDRQPVAGAKTEVEKIGGSEELKGLVALLGMYLRTGATGSGKPIFNYAKLISNSFMARTDFGAMFSMLPLADYNRFIKAPQTFVNLVLDAAGLSGQGNIKVFERGIRKSDLATSPDFNVDATTQIPELGITREKWLLNITLGNDIISSAGMPHLKDQLMGLGALGGRTDRIGNDPAPPKGAINKGKGTIVELRNMKGNIKAANFATLAQQIFDYIVALNENKA